MAGRMDEIVATLGDQADFYLKFDSPKIPKSFHPSGWPVASSSSLRHSQSKIRKPPVQLRTNATNTLSKLGGDSASGSIGSFVGRTL